MDYIQSFRDAIAGKIWPVTVREVQFKDYSDAETPMEKESETHTAGINSFIFFSKVLSNVMGL